MGFSCVAVVAASVRKLACERLTVKKSLAGKPMAEIFSPYSGNACGVEGERVRASSIRMICPLSVLIRIRFPCQVARTVPSTRLSPIPAIVFTVVSLVHSNSGTLHGFSGALSTISM